MSVVRRWGVAVACLASLVVGAALLYRLMTPDSVAALRTRELVAILCSLLLPAATLWAVLAEPAFRAEAPVEGAGPKTARVRAVASPRPEPEPARPQRDATRAHRRRRAGARTVLHAPR